MFSFNGIFHVVDGIMVTHSEQDCGREDTTIVCAIEESFGHLAAHLRLGSYLVEGCSRFTKTDATLSS